MNELLLAGVFLCLLGLSVWVPAVLLEYRPWRWAAVRAQLFWKRFRCDHNVHPDHGHGWVCHTCGKKFWF